LSFDFLKGTPFEAIPSIFRTWKTGIAVFNQNNPFTPANPFYWLFQLAIVVVVIIAIVAIIYYIVKYIKKKIGEIL